jgi:hypothetical protein
MFQLKFNDIKIEEKVKEEKNRKTKSRRFPQKPEITCFQVF